MKRHTAERSRLVAVEMDHTLGWMLDVSSRRPAPPAARPHDRLVPLENVVKITDQTASLRGLQDRGRTTPKGARWPQRR
jgi:hypothetical protein